MDAKPSHVISASHHGNGLIFGSITNPEDRFC
jgi:hypothetical protein